MTVQQLIDKLNKFPKDTRIIALDNVDGPDYDIRDVFESMAVNNKETAGDIMDFCYDNYEDVIALMIKESKCPVLNN
jgi:hypothetical protein